MRTGIGILGQWVIGILQLHVGGMDDLLCRRASFVTGKSALPKTLTLYGIP